MHQLNDKTIDLSPDVPRRWRSFNNGIQQEKPQRKLIITDWGWNHPNQVYALKTFTRGLRSREILQAFVDHPDFDPSFHWSDTMNKNSTDEIDPDLEYIVLMDIETCFESHFPHYTGTFAFNENNISNADDRGGRLVDHKQNRHCYRIYPGCTDNINKVLQSPLFQQAPLSKLLYLDCSGSGPTKEYRRENQPSNQLSILSVAASHDRLKMESDMGFPYGTIYPTQLSSNDEESIKSCNAETERKHLFTWIGDGRKETTVRQSFFNQENFARPEEHVVIHHDNEYDQAEKNVLSIYKEVVPMSVFIGTPRGTNLVPYRLPEALSAGAIPVIVSDGWVPPFSKEVVDWQKCAVFIPDDQAMRTLEILRQVSPEERCQRRQYCYFHIYKKYVINATANLEGVLQRLQVGSRTSDAW